MDLESEFGNVLEMGYGIVVGVGEHTGFHSDRICSESWFGNIPEMMGEGCVPLHWVVWGSIPCEVILLFGTLAMCHSIRT